MNPSGGGSILSGGKEVLFPNKETDDTKVCLDACGVVGPNQCYRREHHSYPRSAEDGFGPDGGSVTWK